MTSDDVASLVADTGGSPSCGAAWAEKQTWWTSGWEQSSDAAWEQSDSSWKDAAWKQSSSWSSSNDGGDDMLIAVEAALDGEAGEGGKEGDSDDEEDMDLMTLPEAAQATYLQIQEVLAEVVAGKINANDKNLQDMRRQSKDDPEYIAVMKMSGKGKKVALAAFQEKFFATKLQDVVTKHTSSETTEKSSQKKSTFESFDWIVREEGGRHNPKNIEAAASRCRECIKRGPKYYRRDKWSKRIQWIYIKDGFKDKHTKKQEIATTGKAVGGAKVGGTGAPGADLAKLAEQDQKKLEEDEQKKKAAEDKKRRQEVHEPNAVDVAVAKATQTKAAYQRTYNKATELTESMQTVSYQEEKAAYEEQIKTLMKTLQEKKDGNWFFKEFLLRETSDVKAAAASTDKLTENCNKFVEDLSEPIKQLKNKLAIVFAVVKARQLAERNAAAVVNIENMPKKKKARKA